MAANRSDGFTGALKRIWGRGGAVGCSSYLFPLPRNLLPLEYFLTYCLPLQIRLSRPHPLGLDRSLHKRRRPPIRSLGSRILRKILRRI